MARPAIMNSAFVDRPYKKSYDDKLASTRHISGIRGVGLRRLSVHTAMNLHKSAAGFKL